MTSTDKFKSLADFLLGWTWDSRPSEFIRGLNFTDPLKGLAAFERRAKENIRRTIIDADRFRLSDDFLLRCMERANHHDPHTLLNTLELARLPFDRPLLVEFDANVACRKRIDQNTVIGDPIPEIIGRDGYLFTPTADGWWAIHISDTEGGMPWWPIACYAHHNPIFAQDDAGLAWEAFVSSAWGLPKKISKDYGTFSAEKELLDRGVAMPEPFISQPLYDLLSEYRSRNMEKAIKRMTQAFLSCAVENAGSMRQASAILASLNCVPTTRVERRPSGKFTHRLRNLSHLAVTNVTIDARPGHTQAVYENSFRTAVHHRRHDVRHHWRDFSRRDAPYCDHEIIDTDNLYALCGKCGRLLRWVKDHERGDESLGRVIHDHYTVQ